MMNGNLVELTYLTAFTIGLLGSTHCLGMCGGIVGVLNAGSARSKRPIAARMGYNLGYNAGRIISYIVAGIIAGSLGALISQSALATVAPYGRFIAGALMIALGLYLAGWSGLIAIFERAGSHLWRIIEPLGRRFMPAKSPYQAFGLGLVWGWLPCGLVYSALGLAIVSASPVGGAATMLAFGLGTLPMLMAMGTAADLLVKLARKPLVRQAAGAFIIMFGIYTCYIALAGSGHHHALQLIFGNAVV